MRRSDGFFRNLPRDMRRVLRPEEQDYADGAAESIFARNAVILSAISLCPLTALFVSLGLVINAEAAAMPRFLLHACLVYPLTGLAGVSLGLMAHKSRHFSLALLCAMVLPALNIGAILGGFLWWALA